VAAAASAMIVCFMGVPLGPIARLARIIHPNSLRDL